MLKFSAFTEFCELDLNLKNTASVGLQEIIMSFNIDTF